MAVQIRTFFTPALTENELSTSYSRQIYSLGKGSGYLFSRRLVDLRDVLDFVKHPSSIL
jgi:hypothetical protein